MERGAQRGKRTPPYKEIDYSVLLNSQQFNYLRSNLLREWEVRVRARVRVATLQVRR